MMTMPSGRKCLEQFERFSQYSFVGENVSGLTLGWRTGIPEFAD